MKTSHSFTNSEESFLLCSLHEVLKVWKRGSSQASFNLDIKDGVATLQLNFHLGNPNDLHYDHHHVPQPDVHYHGHHLHKQARGGRHKGPARREKDRARAAAYQAAKLRAAASAAPSAPVVTEEMAVTAVKLPFSGNMLPLKTKKIGTLQPVPPPPSSLSASSPQSSTYATVVSAVPPPVKKTVERQFNQNISSAKKRLFHPGDPQLHTPAPQPVICHIPPLNDQVDTRCNFKKKEDDLFQKLFS